MVSAEITIMGESAGGISVSYHLMAHGSRNLFKRAILMSGVDLANFGYTKPSKMIETSNNVLKKAGCEKDVRKLQIYAYYSARKKSSGS